MSISMVGALGVPPAPPSPMSPAAGYAVPSSTSLPAPGQTPPLGLTGTGSDGAPTWGWLALVAVFVAWRVLYEMGVSSE